MVMNTNYTQVVKKGDRHSDNYTIHINQKGRVIKIFNNDNNNNNLPLKAIYRIRIIHNNFHKKRYIRDMSSGHKDFISSDGDKLSRQKLSDGERRNNNINNINNAKPLIKIGDKLSKTKTQQLIYRSIKYIIIVE